MRYFVQIGGSEAEREVVVDGETVAIDGQSVRARVDEVPGAPVQLLTVGNEVHRVVARRGDQRGQFDVWIGGYRFTVDAVDERSREIRRLSGAAKRAAGPAHLHAPMPGLIVRVNVAEGDRVRAGQGLVVMEAMKMENELRATGAARVKRVLVSPGSAVEKGAMLLEMEADHE